MKYLRILFILTLVGAVGSSCTQELDLDDDTVLRIEKQEKLEKLDKLFNLAFEDPQKAETDFDTFVQTELITETQNFLSDLDINNKYTLTKLGVQLNLDHFKLSQASDRSNLFDIYKEMYEVDLSNRTLWGSIPEQLKQGESLEKFDAKMDEIEAYYQQMIETVKDKLQIDPAITDTKWMSMIYAYKPDFSKFYFGLYSFTLNEDKTWDNTAFFFIPAIPKIGALAGVQEEGVFTPEDQLAPLVYEVYGDRIFFHFHIKNNYDYETQSGKLERMWNYEFKYELKDGTLVLTQPRLLNYMYPTLISISYDDDVFKTNYLDAFIGFGDPITMTAQ